MSEPGAERLGLNRCDESLHVAVRGRGAFPAHEQPPASVVGVEVVGSLIEVEELTRPDDTGLEVDVRLATRRLVDDVRKIVEIHPDLNQLACSLFGVIDQRDGELGVADPAALTKCCHEVTDHCSQITRWCCGEYRRAGQLQSVGRNSGPEQCSKTHCVCAGVVQLIAPSIVAHILHVGATLRAASECLVVVRSGSGVLQLLPTRSIRAICAPSAPGRGLGDELDSPRTVRIVLGLPSSATLTT